MGRTPPRPHALLREIRRRDVVRVGVVYAVVAWVVIQVAVSTFPYLRLPDWAVTLVIVLALLGFPLALVLSWVFELTPEGIRREGASGPAPEGTGAVPAPEPAFRRDGAITRFMALPLRVLRPDPETDFLAFSLPDAVSCSLSGLRALSIRSNVGVHVTEPLDRLALAEQTGADVVLTGSLLRAGDQVRVTTQLTELMTGALRWSKTLQVPLHDLFELQDKLTRAIVDSLSLPLTAHEAGALRRDVPASPAAYEAYLRANHLSQDPARWNDARDLYLRAVRDDPEYAPAWARLARCYRLISKFAADAEDEAEVRARAEEALRRALELNPDLPMAHCLVALREVELGHAAEAMIRLLARARLSGADPEIFTGLVQTCRYCGLLDASLAAHERVRALDPHARTGVAHTLFLMGDFQRALEEYRSNPIGFMQAQALATLGREREALELLRDRERVHAGTRLQLFARSLRAFLEGREAEGVEASQSVTEGMSDGEALFYIARQLARFGPPPQALALLGRAVDHGFYCGSALERDPWLEPLRATPEFAQILRRAQARSEQAALAYHEAGGEEILGVRALPAGSAAPQPG